MLLGKCLCELLLDQELLLQLLDLSLQVLFHRKLGLKNLYLGLKAINDYCVRVQAFLKCSIFFFFHNTFHSLLSLPITTCRGGSFLL